MLARVIVCIIACCPALKGAYFLKYTRIGRRLILRCWNPELARKCSDICAVQGQKFVYALIREKRLTASV